MKTLAKYKNGNYSVTLKEDGTKVRFTKKKTFVSEYPESIDLKITNRCYHGCEFCHEQSCKTGKHARVNDVCKIFDGMLSGTEVALGGGDPLSHPNLAGILFGARERGVIANMTVNSKSLFTLAHGTGILERLVLLKKEKLFYGLGISGPDLLQMMLNQSHEVEEQGLFDKLIDEDTVIHFIAGVDDPQLLLTMDKRCKKFLILGYKQVGRGKKFYSKKVEKNLARWKYWIKTIMYKKHVSFDNLALKQLDIKSRVSKGLWYKHYMGDDGRYTMFIDAVTGRYAVSSVNKRHKMSRLMDLKTMFQNIKGEI